MKRQQEQCWGNSWLPDIDFTDENQPSVSNPEGVLPIRLVEHTCNVLQLSVCGQQKF